MTRLTGPWYMKRGALGPPYRVTLRRRSNRQPVDLSQVDHVDFVMRRKGETVPVVEAPAAIIQEGDALTGTDVGVCEYDWQVGDTDVSGIYRAEFALYDEVGTPLTRVPNDTYNEIQILGNLSEFYDFRPNGNGNALSALPRVVNLVLYRGDDFSLTINATIGGEPTDLSAAQIRAQIRRVPTSEEVLGEFDVHTADSTIQLSLSGDVIAGLPPACVWDCELSPHGPTVVAGRITIRPQVSRD